MECVFVDDPWDARRDAVIGWYHVYARSTFVRKYINKDVFKMILFYLDTVDLRYALVRKDKPSHVAQLGTSSDGFTWMGSMLGSPCHVCMRPCIGVDILCSRHAMRVDECRCNRRDKCQGGSQDCRKSLYHTHLKCDAHSNPNHLCRVGRSCSTSTCTMAESCAKKIHGLILPKIK